MKSGVNAPTFSCLFWPSPSFSTSLFSSSFHRFLLNKQKTYIAVTHSVLSQNSVIKRTQSKNKKESKNKASLLLVLFKYQKENIQFTSTLLKSPLFSPIHCPQTSQVLSHFFLYKCSENFSPNTGPSCSSFTPFLVPNLIIKIQKN